MKLIRPEDVGALIADDATIFLGGLAITSLPEEVLIGLEQHFLQTGHPRNLTTWAVKVFRTDGDFAQVATIPVGAMPHGLWPSGDGSRIYVGLENGDALAVIDTATNQVTGNIPIGQAPQALAYVSDAVPEGTGTQNLQRPSPDDT